MSPHTAPSRRDLLRLTAGGLGLHAALSRAVAEDGGGPLAPKAGHFAPRAKNSPALRASSTASLPTCPSMLCPSASDPASTPAARSGPPGGLSPALIAASPPGRCSDAPRGDGSVLCCP